MSVIQLHPQFGEDETHTSQNLVLDGISVRLDTYTNIFDDSWYFDLFDADGVPIILGVALAVGLDLLFPYRHLNVPPGILFVQDQSGQPFHDPTIPDFLEGDRALFYVTVDHQFIPQPAANPGEHIEPPGPT